MQRAERKKKSGGRSKVAPGGAAGGLEDIENGNQSLRKLMAKTGSTESLHGLTTVAEDGDLDVSSLPCAKKFNFYFTKGVYEIARLVRQSMHLEHALEYFVHKFYY